MRVIIFLVIAVFAFILGARIVIFMYDHGSVLSSWDSPFWKTWRVPTITAAVILGITLLITIAVRSERKHDAAEKTFALEQGWQYSRFKDDPEQMIPGLEAILKEVTPGRTYTLTTVIKVPYGGRDFFLFNCRYKEKSGKNYQDGSGCLISSERLKVLNSQIDIVPKTVLDNALMFRKVDIGDPEFARNYLVSAQEPADAREVINESLRVVLITYRNDADWADAIEFNLGHGGMVILRWAHIVPDEWLRVLDLARSIEPTIR